MVARGICDVLMKHLFTLLTANWLEVAIKLSEHMIIAYCISAPDVLWLMPVHRDSVNGTHPYKAAETKKQILERHHAMTKTRRY